MHVNIHISMKSRVIPSPPLWFSFCLPAYPLSDLRLPDHLSIVEPLPTRSPARYLTPACLTTCPSSSPCLPDRPPGT
ncbi:unnamed protein product [Boreogadus saida]